MEHWLIRGDSKSILKYLGDESIHCCVTSPPYFNAREYSQWSDFSSYDADMRRIFEQVYRVLGNHRVCIVNVGDITGQLGESKHTVVKLPLGAYFIKMMVEIGFEFVDDYIWDKGEPQSKRFMHGIARPYPLSPLPINAYEHILIFHKHEEDKTPLPCPICHKTIVQNNGLLSEGVQSWECRNPECAQKSEAGRGKRFSELVIMRAKFRKDENKIPDRLIQKWHKDIVQFPPVIKINSKGENAYGHSAPFPPDIPEMAILFYTGKGETVLDPFGGIFTTARVARRYSRNSISIEISEKYWKFGIKSLKISQPTLMGKINYHPIDEANIEKIEIPKSPYWDLQKYISDFQSNHS